MPETDPRTISNQCKRRGVVCASITRLGSRLIGLEDKADQPGTRDLAQRMAMKLETLDPEFKGHHLALVDLIEDEEVMRKKQDTLDEHDDDVTTLTLAIQWLIAVCSL